MAHPPQALSFEYISVRDTVCGGLVPAEGGMSLEAKSLTSHPTPSLSLNFQLVAQDGSPQLPVPTAMPAACCTVPLPGWVPISLEL